MQLGAFSISLRELQGRLMAQGFVLATEAD